MEFGRKQTQFLNDKGIFQASSAETDEAWLRRHMSILGVRMAKLNGIPCFELQETRPYKEHHDVKVI